MKSLRHIPNILSVIRILMIPFFAVSYLNFSGDGVCTLPAAILIASGITDFLDGFIARKFHFESYIGRILDPLGDKLTQFFVCFFVGFKVKFFLIAAALYAVKEIIMLIAGIILTKKDIKIISSKWWGKVATGVFYVVLTTVIFFPTMNEALKSILSVLLMATVLFAFFMYIPEFKKLIQANKAATKE